ncbi:periplasmic heavy metal sensor [Gymnodinialimonas sp.]
MSEGKAPRKGRWLKLVLAVSLALNLAVVGLIAGAVMSGGGPRDAGGAPLALRALGLGPFERALSREDRAELRERLEGAGVELREERRAIGRSLRAVEEALRAEPFDRAAVDAAFARSRGLVVSLQETGHGALLDQIESMSAAEREALADGIARIMRRNGGRR